VSLGVGPRAREQLGDVGVGEGHGARA
jgi:hypothetical protein